MTVNPGFGGQEYIADDGAQDHRGAAHARRRRPRGHGRRRGRRWDQHGHRRGCGCRRGERPGRGQRPLSRSRGSRSRRRQRCARPPRPPLEHRLGVAARTPSLRSGKCRSASTPSRPAAPSTRSPTPSTGPRPAIPLAPVTVIVPTNTAGVMARRALGRLGGVAAVDMLTLYRLAELIGSPTLVAEGRSPVSTAVVDLAIRRVLAEAPGSFATVAEHPSTIVALRDLHRELRLAGPDAVAALAASSPRGREAARISQLTTRRLRSRLVRRGRPARAGRARDAARRAPPARAHDRVPPPATARAGNCACFARSDSWPTCRSSSASPATRQRTPSWPRSRPRSSQAGRRPSGLPSSRHWRSRRTVEVISTTDADDEVRLAVRAVLDAGRAGTPFARMAVLWSAERPYARLVEHHLDVAEIEWNGRPGTAVGRTPRAPARARPARRRPARPASPRPVRPPRRRARPRRRRSSGSTPRPGSGSAAPPASSATITGPHASVPTPRANGAATTPPRNAATGNAADAEALATFVDRAARRRSVRPTATRPWSEWAAWCGEQIERWIGRAPLQHLDDAERAAYEQVDRVLDRLRHLDAIGPPVHRARVPGHVPRRARGRATAPGTHR